MAYYQQQRPQYLSLMDMIDGGGAGRAGDTFQGGGILSALGNTMMRPAGYEERLRDRKNSTGRAITTAVQEMTGGAPNRSMRPEMRQFTPQNLPNEVPMGAPLQDVTAPGGGMVPPAFTDGPDFNQFLQDLRLKEQVYGMPPTPLAEVEVMYEEYNQRRMMQVMPSSGFTAPSEPPMPNPLPQQSPSFPMPGY